MATLMGLEPTTLRRDSSCKAVFTRVAKRGKPRRTGARRPLPVPNEGRKSAQRIREIEIFSNLRCDLAIVVKQCVAKFPDDRLGHSDPALCVPLHPRDARAKTDSAMQIAIPPIIWRRPRPARRSTNAHSGAIFTRLRRYRQTVRAHNSSRPYDAARPSTTHCTSRATRSCSRCRDYRRHGASAQRTD